MRSSGCAGNSAGADYFFLQPQDEKRPAAFSFQGEELISAGSYMRRVNLRFTRLRDPFLPRLPGDARWALPILALACVLRGKRRARTPCLPPCRITMRRGVVALLLIPVSLEDPASGNAARPSDRPPWLATLAPPAVRDMFLQQRIYEIFNQVVPEQPLGK